MCKPSGSGGPFRQKRFVLFALCAALALGAAVPATPGLHTGVVFDRESPLASTAEIVRRSFTPLTVEHIIATHSVAGQPIDVAKETFAVYLPARKPPEGYALLVFVPPQDGAKLPFGWASVLDEKGVIFVSPDRSGNHAKVESRRMPLAVIAAEQLRRDFQVDPSRLLVGGFSGGSRVALRLALAYPDVFRGALLNSGSDPIGTANIPLPPADLLHRFQESSRIYYLTGDIDTTARNMQAASEASLQRWCVFGVHATAIPHTAHAAADARTLSLALDSLLDPAPSNHNGLAACRAGLQSELASEVQRIEALIAGDDKAAARQALTDLDAKYGNLAASQILVLEKKLG